MKQSVLVVGFVFSASLTLTAGDVAAGKPLYDKSCKSCHGASGAANPAIVKMMKVEIKDLTAADVQALSDGDLKKIITNGQGKMKPVKNVTGKDLDHVIEYVRSLKK